MAARTLALGFVGLHVAPCGAQKGGEGDPQWCEGDYECEEPHVCVDMNKVHMREECLSDHGCVCLDSSDPGINWMGPEAVQVEGCAHPDSCGDGYDCMSAMWEFPVEECPEGHECFCVEKKPCNEWCDGDPTWMEHKCSRFVSKTEKCGPARLQGVKKMCDECSPLVDWFTIQDYGGTCEKYCGSQGLGCWSMQDAPHSCDGLDYGEHHACTEEPHMYGKYVCHCDFPEDDNMTYMVSHRVPTGANAEDAEACAGFVDRWHECMHYMCGADESMWPTPFVSQEWSFETFDEFRDYLGDAIMKEIEGKHKKQCHSISPELMREYKVVGCAGAAGAMDSDRHGHMDEHGQH